jgi:hypothetical protein
MEGIDLPSNIMTRADKYSARKYLVQHIDLVELPPDQDYIDICSLAGTSGDPFRVKHEFATTRKYGCIDRLGFPYHVGIAVSEKAEEALGILVAGAVSYQNEGIIIGLRAALSDMHEENNKYRKLKSDGLFFWERLKWLFKGLPE